MTREQQQQNNRVLLLESAERIFSERGVDSTSLDDIALEAGLTKGAVYSNFHSKGELILEVIRYRQENSQEGQEFHQILESMNDDYDRLEAWCDMWSRTFEKGDRSLYARLLFDFIPYALKDQELISKFADLISPSVVKSSPIPSESNFSKVSIYDQFRILTALDLGLSALKLFDPEGIKPELYKTAVLSMAHTSYLKSKLDNGD